MPAVFDSASRVVQTRNSNLESEFCIVVADACGPVRASVGLDAGHQDFEGSIVGEFGVADGALFGEEGGEGSDHG